MEPIRKDKPSPLLFLGMTALYLGAFFGIKYGVFGGRMPWYANLALIALALLAALRLRSRFARAGEEGNGPK